MDLCNPGAGYDPVTASDGIELVKGEYHNYQVFLNATRYTLAKGHRPGSSHRNGGSCFLPDSQNIFCRHPDRIGKSRDPVFREFQRCVEISAE